MYKATFTIKHGRAHSHIHKQYDHSLLLDEAENEAFLVSRDYLGTANIALEYIGGWEWAIRVDDRTIAYVLWTLKG